MVPSSPQNHSPPLTSSATGHSSPAHTLYPQPPRPALAPIATSLHNKSSVDRLRSQGNSSASSDAESSRPNSPHQSMTIPRPGLPTPRPTSMSSISSRYLHVGPAGGAPHQKRMTLEMPRPLGARPDENGDFFGSAGRLGLGDGLGWEERERKHSRKSSRAWNEADYASPPIHQRVPSHLSLSNYSASGQATSDEQAGSASGGSTGPMIEERADPAVVLRRK
ncbi:hypothetical protein P7C73_g645, partial [Tremellales sp. Uapishka_1]